MVIIEPEQKPKIPECANKSNLVCCDHCHAIYDKTLNWVYGSWEGTTGHFNADGRIAKDCCPMCRKERNE